MPFLRQTLTQLRAQVQADITAWIPADTDLLRFSPTRILGNAIAALVNGLYGYLDWIARQAVPFTATDEYLEGWAGLKRVIRKPATQATAVVSFAGANGSVLSAGTPLTRADGATLLTTQDGTVAGGSVAVSVVAVVPGSSGNANAGTPVTLSIGVPGIASTGVALNAFTGGADAEADAPLRTRMLAAYAAPAQGGALGDYETWALAVPGVTRAWPRANAMGAGTVSVFFMMDGSEAAHGGFPQGSNGVASAETRAASATGDQLAVADAIYAEQPVTALVYAVAPGQNSITLTVALAGASAATKAAVQAAAAAAVARGSAPGGTTNISDIEYAIAGIAAASGFVITNVTASAGVVTPGAAGNILSNSGCLPVMLPIQWA